MSRRLKSLCIALLCGCTLIASLETDPTYQVFFDEPVSEVSDSTTRRSTFKTTTPTLVKGKTWKRLGLDDTITNTSDCRKVCTPSACISAKCTNYRNATCITDVCNCSARFITLKDDRTGVVDVTDFCIQTDNTAGTWWTLPTVAPQVTQQVSNPAGELPVIPDGSFANTVANFTEAPEVTSTTRSTVNAATTVAGVISGQSAAVQSASVTVQPAPVAPLAGVASLSNSGRPWGAPPVQVHTWGRQPVLQSLPSTPLTGSGFAGQGGGYGGGGLGIFTPLTYGQNGLYNIAPAIIRQLPFGSLVVPGYGATGQLNDEMTEDKDQKVDMDDQDVDDEDDSKGELERVKRQDDAGGSAEPAAGGAEAGGEANGAAAPAAEAGGEASGAAAPAAGGEPPAPAAGGGEEGAAPPGGDGGGKSPKKRRNKGSKRLKGGRDDDCRRICRRRRRCFRRSGVRICRRRRICRRICD